MTDPVLGIGYSLRNTAPELPGIRDGLDEAGRLGVDFVELPLYAMDMIVGGRVRPEPLRELKAIMADHKLGYTVHGPLAINLMDDAARLALHMDVLKAAIEISGELGAVHYVLHGGTCVDLPASKLEARYAQQRDALAEIADFAAAHKIIVTVETLFAYEISKQTALPSKLAEELAAIDHPNIRACFDFSHSFIHSTLHGADYMAEAKALAPSAKHLHIHDSFGRPKEIMAYSRGERIAFGQGDLHLPLGWGVIPWDQLMDQLALPQDVIFMLELPPEHWSELGASIARIRELATRAKATHRELRISTPA